VTCYGTSSRRTADLPWMRTHAMGGQCRVDGMPTTATQAAGFGLAAFADAAAAGTIPAGSAVSYAHPPRYSADGMSAMPALPTRSGGHTSRKQWRLTRDARR
jgi:hypothetical protein